MDGKSEDLVKDNIQALGKLFPEVLCDGKIDFHKLQNLLGDAIDNAGDRYNFTWHGKDAALRLSQTPSLGTLRPCKEESKDWDTTQNLYIEGDNLEVLKLLQKSYHGKVKMIYIDPPYNTGSDFVYHDDFRDSLENYKRLTGQADDDGKTYTTNSETSGRYHTDWLNMIYPRLRLARNLLREDGVIFFSIDDSEQGNLKKICDEVFGEDNFICNFIWKSKLGKVGTAATISSTHEYILCYSKNKDCVKFKMIETPNDGRKENLRQWGQADRREDRPSMYYPISIDGVEIYPIKEDGSDGRWRVGQDKANELLANGELEAVKKNGKYEIYRIFPSGVSMTSYETMLNDVGTTARGAAALKALGMTRSFDYSKPVELLKHFVDLVDDRDAVVLDFFSGSATTAHAVMKSNASDGGNRRFIMVQLPEKCADGTEANAAGYNTICKIGEERIRRSGQSIVDGCAEGADKPDVGFRVFKLDTSNLRKWQPPTDDAALEQTLQESVNNIASDRTEEDLLYEIILKMGFDLSWPIETREAGGVQVFVVAAGALFICLADNITPSVAEGMAKLHHELAPEVWKVVCRDTGFRDDAAKVNVREILKAEGLDDAAFVTV